MMYLHEVATRT